MTEKLPAQATLPPRRIALELRLDRDGRYRWFEMETDADTEVSGATPEQAWTDASLVWRSPTWDFQRLSPTMASIIADDGGTGQCTRTPESASTPRHNSFRVGSQDASTPRHNTFHAQTKDPFSTTYHRDHTVTIWDVFTQSWTRTDRPSDAILASLMPDERARVMRHCRIDGGRDHA